MFGSLKAKPHSLGNAIPSRVFISYSRNDMEVTDSIVAALEERRVEVFIDRRSLPLIGKWQEEIEALILASDAIIWLVSRSSIGSDWCKWELGIRNDQRQMLIPVLVDDTRPEDLPEGYAAWQCLSFFELDDFDGEIDKLVEALRAPHAWIKQQRWLADQASRADNRLRGQALADAKAWLDNPPDTAWLQANPAFAPEPTAAIRALIERSRRLARRDRCLLAAAAVFGMLAVTGTAWYTVEQDQIADSQRWARASSQATERGNAASGLLLALKGLPDEGDFLKRPVVTEARRAAYAAISALRERTVFKGHGAALTHAEMSSDGSLLLTSSLDGTARLWRMDGVDQDDSPVLGHEPRLSNDGHSSVTMASLSPDGSRIVTVSNDHTGILWNAEGEIIAKLERHTRPVLFARFSPDGRSIVTAGEDYTARLWSAIDGRHVRDFKGHEHFVVAADFSPDGQLLATASSDGTARLWSIDGKAEPIVLHEHKDRVLSVAFDNTGSLVATTSRDGSALLWATDGKLMRRLDGHSGVVNRLRFSPDMPLAITASDDNTAKLWNLSNGGEAGTLADHDARMIDARFSADGETILTASVDGAIGLWRLSQTGSDYQVDRYAMLRGHELDIVSANFSSDGRWVISSSKDGTARLWRATEDPGLDHPCDVRSFAFSGDGDRVLTACKGGLVRIWNARNRTVIQEMDIAPRQIIAVGFSPVASLIALGHENGSISLYGPRGDKLDQIGKDLVGHEARVRSIDFSPDGRRLVSGSADETARVWDVASGELLHLFEDHEDRVRSAHFDPEGERVLSVSADGTAKIWDSRTGQMIRSFDAHQDDVWAAGFSPDGTRIVTGSTDGQLLITDIQGSVEPRRLVGHGDNIRSAAFSPDGRHVVSASWDRTARLWDAQTGEELHVTRNADIILGAAFDPAGTRFGYLVKERVIFSPAFPTVEAMVATAKGKAPAVRNGEGPDANRSDETRAGLFARIGGVIPKALGQK